MNKKYLHLAAALGVSACAAWTSPSAEAAAPVLESIFNGVNLDGWAQRPAGSFKVNAAEKSILTTGSSGGSCYTLAKYTSYRILFTVRQNVWTHWPTTLYFGTDPARNGMAGIQFELASSHSWDYRSGHNNDGSAFIDTFSTPSLKRTGVWYRCEVLVNNATGTADASAAMVGGPAAVHVIKFTDPNITKLATPFAIQSHNRGVSDEYKDILVEVNPQLNQLVTLVLHAPSAATAQAVSSSRVNVSWKDNSSNETGFKIFHSTDNVKWTLGGTAAANATSFANNGLNPSTTYYFRVAAILPTAISDYATTSGAKTMAGSVFGNGTYKVINRASSLALDAKASGTANGTLIDQYTYHASANQTWKVTSLGGGQYQILGTQSGRSLDVKGKSLLNAAPIQLFDYTGGANQKWIITSTSGGFSTITGVQSGKVVEVVGASTARGALVDQGTNTGSNSQQWSFQAP